MKQVLLHIICFKEDCGNRVNLLQWMNVQNGMNDINFNFVITPYGIFEGRGWDVQTEETGPDFDSISLGFVSEFMTDELFDVASCVMYDGFFFHKLRDPFNYICEDNFCQWRNIEFSINLNCGLNVTASHALRT